MDYLVNINGKAKVFHINILRKYLERPAFLKQILTDDLPEQLQQANSVIILPEAKRHEEDMPVMMEFPEVKQKQTFKELKISENLTW